MDDSVVESSSFVAFGGVLVSRHKGRYLIRVADPNYGANKIKDRRVNGVVNLPNGSDQVGEQS